MNAAQRRYLEKRIREGLEHRVIQLKTEWLEQRPFPEWAKPYENGWKTFIERDPLPDIGPDLMYEAPYGNPNPEAHKWGGGIYYEHTVIEMTSEECKHIEETLNAGDALPDGFYIFNLTGQRLCVLKYPPKEQKVAMDLWMDWWEAWDNIDKFLEEKREEMHQQMLDIVMLSSNSDALFALQDLQKWDPFKEVGILASND
jgi:hypothetical protein